MSRQQLSIACVGDIACNSSTPNCTVGIERFLASTEVRRTWQYADIRSGNLEAPTTSRGRKVWSKLSLRAPIDICQRLRRLGFDMLSIANNHMMDFGQDGLNECMSHAHDANIAFGGGGLDLARAAQPTIIESRNGRIAFFCWCDVVQDSPLYATPTHPGVAPLRVNEAVQQIKAVKSSVDWVVCHIHWGEEFCQLPSPSQRSTARELANAGVDLIIGHHPHVLQGAEIIETTAVLYSLGNFLFYPQRWTGVNAGGERFYARYRLHPLSRLTGLASVTLNMGCNPEVHFTPAFLNRKNVVVPEMTEERFLQWGELCNSLDGSGYAERFEKELELARKRKAWCGEWRTPLGRIDLMLFKYGLRPGFRN